MEFKIENKENSSSSPNVEGNKDQNNTIKIKTLQKIVKENDIINEKLRDENECLHNQQIVLVSLLNQKETQINKYINSTNPKLKKNIELNTDITETTDKCIQIVPYLNSRSTSTNNNNTIQCLNTASMVEIKSQKELSGKMQILRAKSSYSPSIKQKMNKKYGKAKQLSYISKDLSSSNWDYYIASNYLSFHSNIKSTISISNTINTINTISSLQYSMQRVRHTSSKTIIWSTKKTSSYKQIKRAALSIILQKQKIEKNKNSTALKQYEMKGCQTSNMPSAQLIALTLSQLIHKHAEKKLAYCTIQNNALTEMVNETKSDLSIWMIEHSVKSALASTMTNIIQKLKSTAKLAPCSDKLTSIHSKFVNLYKKRVFRIIKAGYTRKQNDSYQMETMSNKVNINPLQRNESSKDKERIEELTRLVAQLRSENDKLYSKSESSINKLKQIEGSVSKFEKENQESEKRNEKLSNQLKEIELKYLELLNSKEPSKNVKMEDKKPNKDYCCSPINTSSLSVMEKLSMLEQQNKELQLALENCYAINNNGSDNDPHMRIQYAQKFNEAQEKIQEYEEHILELKAQISTLNNDCATLKDKEDNLEEHLRQAKQMNQIITQENQEKSEAIAKFNELNQSLIAEQKKSKDEIFILSKQVKTEKAKCEALNAEAKSLKTQLANNQGENKSQEAINGAFKKMAADKQLLIEQLEIAAQDIKQLKDSHTKQVEYSNLVKNQIEFLKSQNVNQEENKKTIADLKEKIEMLSKEKLALEKKKPMTTAKKCAPAKKVKAETEKDISFTTSTEGMDDIEKAKLTIEQLRGVISKQQSSIIEKNDSIDCCKRQNGEVTKELVSVTNQLTQAVQKLKDAEEKLKQAESENNKLVNSSSMYKDDMEKIKNEMQSRVQSEREKISLTERKYEFIITKEKEDGHKQVDALKRECTMLKSKIEELTIQFNHDQGITQNEINNTKTQAITAQQRLSNLEKEKIVLNQKIGQLQRELSKNAEQTTRIENELDAKSKELKSYKLKATSGKEELAKAFEDLESYAKILESLEKKVANLQKERDGALLQKESVEKELRDLKKVMCNS